MDDRNGFGQIMKQDYDQIRILPWDIKRLRRDNPQRALFENVERVAGLAQVKINTHRTRCWWFSRSGKVQITCHSGKLP